MNEFGKRLRELREARGWTRYRLAKLAGLTTEGVVKLERPGSDPKLSTLVKLAGALSASVCELLCGPTAEGQARKVKGNKKAAGRGASPARPA